MSDKEDCGCGFAEPEPEVACRLEFEDAIKFHHKFQSKQDEFAQLQKRASRTKNAQKKKEMGIQAINLQREIKQLEKGMDLAILRFTKCESTNPQLQNLNDNAVESKMKGIWNAILTADKLNNGTNGSKKKRRKK